jgi:RNA polymerase subunit RPABC4/transcription elongation factor Spt4
MFCRNCGKELIGSPEICPNCGARPMRGNSFCSNCGAPTTPLTEVCVKCGARVVGREEAGLPKRVLRRIVGIVLLGILISVILVDWVSFPIPIYYRLLAPSGWLLIGAIIGIVFLARKGVRMTITSGILMIIGGLQGMVVGLIDAALFSVSGSMVLIGILAVVLAIMGGVLTLMRKHWRWALVGAIFSTLLSIPFGLPAIILLIKSKGEFQ